MKCPICNEDTWAVRSVYAGNAAKAQERHCPNGHRWTYALVLVGEIKKRGDGPGAVAARIARGEQAVLDQESTPDVEA